MRKNHLPSRPHFVLPLVLLIVSSFLSCSNAQKNNLKGSVEELFPLNFTDVQAQFIIGEGLAIIYTSPIANSTDVEEALRLVIATDNVAIQKDTSIDLVPIATLSRFRLKVDINGQTTEDREAFPSLISGNIEFSEFALTTDSEIEGRFEMIFLNGDTMLGDFSTTISVAN